MSKLPYIVGRWPTLDEITIKLNTTAKYFAEKMCVNQIGQSVLGRPILLVRLTDPMVDDDNKQVVVFTGAEHGHERNGLAVLLQLIDWLLKDSEGQKTLRNQIVFIIPVVNVDGYASEHLFETALPNHNGINLFADYHYDGSKPSQPESQAVWQLIEDVNPDAFISLHGTSLDHEASGLHLTWESTNIAITSQYERCYSRKVIDRISDAAEQAGYPQDRGEEDMERILPMIPGFEHHCLPTYEHVATPGSYCYNRFHTLAMSMEIGVVESGFVRVRELLRIGNEKWAYECYNGYPNRIITGMGGNRFGITAAGSNPSQRRENRVKLWQRSRDFLIGFNRSHATHFVGFATRIEEDTEPLIKLSRINELLDFFQSRGMNIDKMRNWIDQVDLGDSLVLAGSDRHAVARCQERTGSIYNSDSEYDKSDVALIFPAASLRVRIDRRVQPLKIMLNGQNLLSTAYRCWCDNRFNYVEVDLSPEWQRAILAVETTAISGCRIFNTGN